jgi:hypothetical protein
MQTSISSRTSRIGFICALFAAALLSGTAIADPAGAPTEASSRDAFVEAEGQQQQRFVSTAGESGSAAASAEQTRSQRCRGEHRAGPRGTVRRCR